MRDAFVFLQNFEKRLAVDRVAAKFGVHHIANVVEGSQCFGRQPLDPLRLLKEQKGFQNGVGVFLIEVVLRNINQAIEVIEVIVDFPNFNAQIAPFRLKMSLNVEQQYLVQLGDSLGCPVVLTHQNFTGSLLVLAIWRTYGLETKAIC